MIKSLFIMAAETVEAPAAGGSLPQMDFSTYPSQIFWLALTFGALYWLMSTYFLPRLGATLEERRDRIADDLDKAAEGRRMAEEAEAAYNRALADARAKAQAIAAETRDEVAAEIAALQKTAEQSIAEKSAAAERSIAAMKASAASKVREAAVDATRAIVETLISETPTEQAAIAAVAAAAKA